MLDPQGPLSKEIYWRRRMLGGAIFALIFVVAVGLLIIFNGGRKMPNGADIAVPETQGSGTTSALPRVSSTALPQPTTGFTTVPASTSAASGLPGIGPIQGTQPGGPCIDSGVAVVVSSDKPVYRLGEKPIFSAVVTNASAVQCTRDVGTGMQQILVYSLDGTRRIWSNFDCSFQPGIEMKLLNPGGQVAFKMQWFGTNSVPKCPAGSRKQVPMGEYRVYAQIGEKRSEPVTFNIVN